MAEYTAYFKGEWMPFSQVKIDPMDRGFTVGDVVFDVARTFNGKSFRMEDHIQRLYRSLKFVRIDPGLSAKEMLDISEEVVQRNDHLRAEVGDSIRDQRSGELLSKRRPPSCLRQSCSNWFRAIC